MTATPDRFLRPSPRPVGRDGVRVPGPSTSYAVHVAGEVIGTVTGSDRYGWHANPREVERGRYRRGLDALGMTNRWLPVSPTAAECAALMADAREAGSR